MNVRERLLKMRKRAKSMSLAQTITMARTMNRRLSLSLLNNDRGLGASTMKGAIGRTMEAFRDVEFRGIKFFQCPHSGFVVMKIPETTFTEDFLEMMEIAYEGKLENLPTFTNFDHYKLQSLKSKIKRIRGITGKCRCGCGELTYNGKEWLPGHNGRVMGWFANGKIPSHLIEEFRYWEKNGCLPKTNTPTSGTT